MERGCRLRQAMATVRKTKQICVVRGLQRRGGEGPYLRARAPVSYRITVETGRRMRYAQSLPPLKLKETCSCLQRRSDGLGRTE